MKQSKLALLIFLSASLASATIAPANGGTSYAGSCREDTNAGCSVTINSTGATLLVTYCIGNWSSCTPTENKGNGAATCEPLQSNNSTGQLCYWLNPATVGSGHIFTLNTGIVFSSFSVAAFTSSLPMSFGSYVHNEAGTGSGGSVETISTGSITPTVGALIVTGVGIEEPGSSLSVADSTYTITLAASVMPGPGSFDGTGIGYTVANATTAANPHWDWTSTGGSGSRTITVAAIFIESATASRRRVTFVR